MNNLITNKKGAFEVSFAWVFAIVIGAFILFLAIFAAVKLIGLGEEESSAKTSKEIGILLNPLETGFESARSASFNMPVDTRIYGSCDLDGNFGKQLISVSQKSFNKWTETDLEVQFLNKYIFNTEFVEGRKFYVFSKPFEFPFKVGDLIYLSSSKDEYCLLDAPDEIGREIENLNQPNLVLGNCSENAIRVCFSGGVECNVEVDYVSKAVRKSSGIMYFENDALMYAAIFSDKEIYECQLQRLMKRISELATIYENKIIITSREGCDSNLAQDLAALKIMVKNVESSGNLGKKLNAIVEGIIEDNKYSSECKLW
ncbi:hypothetical protein HN832_02605 [archaeon]|jgi:hypothetical protein|nr:hypothetical protein [archaeon]MBT4373245.1 hypothetical protein [archaeon]MBT4531590.1 hypothetical protein [archaeon]MBT7001232.1 hypothetical protein [archaeon]MBT7282282.1 hypothetical protein [archaeon]